jgi:hypothetical protein
MNKVDREKLIILLLVILVIGLLVYILWPSDTGQEITEKVETEEAQPTVKETEASKNLEENLQELTKEKTVTSATPEPKSKPAPKSKSSTSKINTNPYNVDNYSSWLKSANGVPYSSVTFKMPQGKKPNLSGLKGDMGTILVPLASNSSNYVAVMYLKKEAIKKMAPYVKDLSVNVVPMTNKPEYGGRKWTTDASGTVYFFRDAGQKFAPNPEGKATAKLACYLGDKQEQVNGQTKTYGIWLGWEVSQLANAGVLELNNATQILHRPYDNGKVLVNVYKNVSNIY